MIGSHYPLLRDIEQDIVKLLYIHESGHLSEDDMILDNLNPITVNFEKDKDLQYGTYNMLGVLLAAGSTTAALAYETSRTAAPFITPILSLLINSVKPFLMDRRNRKLLITQKLNEFIKNNPLSKSEENKFFYCRQLTDRKKMHGQFDKINTSIKKYYEYVSLHYILYVNLYKDLFNELYINGVINENIPGCINKDSVEDDVSDNVSDNIYIDEEKISKIIEKYNKQPCNEIMHTTLQKFAILNDDIKREILKNMKGELFEKLLKIRCTSTAKNQTDFIQFLNVEFTRRESEQKKKEEKEKDLLTESRDRELINLLNDLKTNVDDILYNETTLKEVEALYDHDRIREVKNDMDVSKYNNHTILEKIAKKLGIQKCKDNPNDLFSINKNQFEDELSPAIKSNSLIAITAAFTTTLCKSSGGKSRRKINKQTKRRKQTQRTKRRKQTKRTKRTQRRTSRK